MQKWEYLIVGYEVDIQTSSGRIQAGVGDVTLNGELNKQYSGKTVLEILNLLGAEGWQLTVSLGGSILVFKRPKE